MTALSFVPRWWRRGSKKADRDRLADIWHSDHSPVGYESDVGDAGCMWCDHFTPYDRAKATSRDIWGLCAIHTKPVPEHGFCPQWKDSPLPQPPEVTT